MSSRIFLVDVAVLGQKYRKPIDIIRGVLPDETRRRIGNFTPLIVASPRESARKFATALSEHYKGAPVYLSDLLLRSYLDVYATYQKIWNAMRIPKKDRHRFIFFLVEQ